MTGQETKYPDRSPITFSVVKILVGKFAKRIYNLFQKFNSNVAKSSNREVEVKMSERPYLKAINAKLNTSRAGTGFAMSYTVSKKNKK